MRTLRSVGYSGFPGSTGAPSHQYHPGRMIARGNPASGGFEPSSSWPLAYLSNPFAFRYSVSHITGSQSFFTLYSSRHVGAREPGIAASSHSTPSLNGLVTWSAHPVFSLLRAGTRHGSVLTTPQQTGNPISHPSILLRVVSSPRFNGAAYHRFLRIGAAAGTGIRQVTRGKEHDVKLAGLQKIDDFGNSLGLCGHYSWERGAEGRGTQGIFPKGRGWTRTWAFRSFITPSSGAYSSRIRRRS